MLIAGDVAVVVVEVDVCWMFILLSASARFKSSMDVVVTLESGLGKQASTPNRTIIFMLNISYPKKCVFNELGIAEERKRGSDVHR